MNLKSLSALEEQSRNSVKARSNKKKKSKAVIAEEVKEKIKEQKNAS